MEVSVFQEKGPVSVTRFAISGAFNSDEPVATLAREAYEQGARNILMDMTDVPYMSSAGLRALHSVYMLLRDPSESKSGVNKGLRDGSYHSPNLKILKPSKLVQEVLKTAGYDMFIETHDDLQAALMSYRAD